MSLFFIVSSACCVRGLVYTCKKRSGTASCPASSLHSPYFNQRGSRGSRSTPALSQLIFHPFVIGSLIPVVCLAVCTAAEVEVKVEERRLDTHSSLLRAP
ncbi:hypothetical protein J3F84DRAFT_358376 [Trichoderma pleuroticola]